MPTPEHSNGAPCWIDLMTSDTEKAKSFYGALFGWTFQTGDQEKYGGYITASKDGKSVAGVMQKMEDQAAMPDMWSTYLQTGDAAATAAAVTANRRPGLHGTDGCARTGPHGHLRRRRPVRRSASGSHVK